MRWFFILFLFLSLAGAAGAETLSTQVSVAVIPNAPASLSATANSSSRITLSWTDNSSNEEGFQIERKAGTGGLFAQIATSAANIASYADSGLSSGIAYTYRVRAFSGDGSSDYSSEASATTESENLGGSTGGGGSGGGGGGGGGSGGWSATALPVTASVTFKGKAYPKSAVTLLKDAQVAAVTQAGPDANFEVTLGGISAGNYSFGLWAEDDRGERSLVQTFRIAVTEGAATRVSGIFLPPTIGTDKSEVKRGEPLTIFGQSLPDANIALAVNSDEEIVQNLVADEGGRWSYQLDTLALEYGDHTARARAAKGGEISTLSHLASFKVGARTVLAPVKKRLQGNLNGDDRVNLVDFSILAYWFRRPSPPPNVDLNNDGKINLVDFSIMAYYWTG